MRRQVRQVEVLVSGAFGAIVGIFIVGGCLALFTMPALAAAATKADASHTAQPL